MLETHNHSNRSTKRSAPTRDRGGRGDLDLQRPDLSGFQDHLTMYGVNIGSIYSHENELLMWGIKNNHSVRPLANARDSRIVS